MRTAMERGTERRAESRAADEATACGLGFQKCRQEAAASVELPASPIAPGCIVSALLSIKAHTHHKR